LEPQSKACAFVSNPGRKAVSSEVRDVCGAFVSLGNVSRTDSELQLTVQLTGSPNYPYILQMATDMTPPVNWQPIFTNPADGNGNWSFTVTNLPCVPAGYYCAVGQ
jgi:hypothetical protein